MIVGCILDYYIIYLQKKKNIDDNKNIDKFGFVASFT